jgi:RHS repeat-associated protein
VVQTILSYSRSGNRYKYQTKEVDNYFDYNILDFGARHYDPATARWTVYDPASQYATPFIAMGGNPVSGIDPTGTVSHRLSDAQANLQQAQEQMGAVDNATGGGSGAVPWYYYSSRDVAAMQLQYGTTYEQQTQEHFATLAMFGVTGDIASAAQQNDMLTLNHEGYVSMTKSITSNSPNSNSKTPVIEASVEFSAFNPENYLTGFSEYFNQNDIPVWGACNQGGSCINNGDYLGGGTWFVVALLEAATFGYASGLRFSLNVSASEIAQFEKIVYTVTKEGVVLPKGAKIPANFIENANRSSNYGIIQNGKFLEKVRIDQATPFRFNGPNQSHFHLDNGGHIFDAKKWPWW